MLNFNPANSAPPVPSVMTLARGVVAPLNGLTPGTTTDFRKPTAARKWWAFTCQGQLALLQPETAADALHAICDFYTFSIYQTPVGMTMIGRFGLKTKKRLETLEAMLGDSSLSQCQLHAGAATAEDPVFFEDDSQGGSTAQTAVRKLRGPWSHLTHGLEIPDYVLRMEREGMYPWQRKVVDSIETDGERIVNFVVDSRGNSGKSTIGMWLLVKGYGKRLACTASPKELSASVLDTPNKKCFIVDLPRTFRNHEAMEKLFGAIEEIKNGFAEDHRYHHRMATFQPPAVWVFANSLPDLSFLSMDRWRIWLLEDKDLRPHPHAVSRVSAALRSQYRGVMPYASTVGDQFTSAVAHTNAASGPVFSAGPGSALNPGFLMESPPSAIAPTSEAEWLAAWEASDKKE